jgi:hypothetical protein
LEDRVTNPNLTPLLAKVVVSNPVNNATLAVINFGLIIFSREDACRLANLSCVVIDAERSSLGAELVRLPTNEKGATLTAPHPSALLDDLFLLENVLLGSG